MAGKLYLCATPIGNLEDMTFRAIRILQEVDLIAAEDTRNSIKLLNHFEIHTPMTSYHEYNKYDKGRELVQKLLAGTNIALITDAGTPGISDPGEELVKMAYEAGMPGYGKTTFNRINPDEVLKQYAPDPEMMMPDPIIALKQVQMAAGWEKLLENLYKDNSMEALDKILPGSQPASEEKEKR